MQWDANGNMTYFNSSATGETRRMCWDEENRLAIVKDSYYASHYIYDAGGERKWKITGPIERMSINGGLYVDQTMLDYKTLYASPYMVISDAEYTKHFYAESQRVTTKLGGGFSPSLVDAHSATLDPIEGTIEDISQNLWDYIYQNTQCVDGEPDYVSINPSLPIVEELFGSNNDEGDLYFYHPDHLGSSSFISDVNGDVNQHLQYLPFGESFIDQQTNHSIRYTFSSKEKDTETNYSYFGARYYNSDISVWLSVDPMADQYPSMSSFMYCAGNPVMLVDPNGMNADDFYFNKDGKLDKYVENDQPDRVFVSTGETKVDPNDPDLVPEPVYNQVEMSSEEIEQKMNDNGYKKVIKERVTLEKTFSYNYGDANGDNPNAQSQITEVEKIIKETTKYTKKGNIVIGVKKEQLREIDKDIKQPVTSVTEIVSRKYQYGKSLNNSNCETIREYTLKGIKFFMDQYFDYKTR